MFAEEPSDLTVSRGMEVEPRRRGRVLLASVDRAVESRWTVAVRTAAATSGEIDERVTQIRTSFARELAMAGAAAGAVAAAPGVGTAGAVSAALGEVGWFTMRSADLILTIAAAHGHTQASVEERRAWVLSVLAFGNGAASGFNKIAGEAGKGLGKKATSQIPASALRQINQALGRTIVTKYGTKRGAIALGRVLPFGIGAVIGGGANYAQVRVLSRHADIFFRQLPDGLGRTRRTGAGS